MSLVEPWAIISFSVLSFSIFSRRLFSNKLYISLRRIFGIQLTTGIFCFLYTALVLFKLILNYRSNIFSTCTSGYFSLSSVTVRQISRYSLVAVVKSARPILIRYLFSSVLTVSVSIYELSEKLLLLASFDPGIILDKSDIEIKF